ncbi:PE family protein [Labilithrix luteola]|uniref:PE family protein n=1 Tax=Labilithrix luteola TaxID=1391654 RepID=A0A0K1Q9T3_9BACT|nr:PE family protein [Labilithrix luteola]
MAPSGTADGDGSRARPLGSIAAAIEKAKPQAKRVYVCTGIYKEALVLANAVTLIGGLECGATWKLTSTGRSQIEAPTSPALRANDITNDTSFMGFTVTAPNGTQANPSSFGLIAHDAKHLRIVSSTIRAGNGLAGVAGTGGAGLAEGATANGGSGTSSIDPYPASRLDGIKGYPSCAGGAGGVSTCGGGTGGRGGSGGVFHCVLDPGSTTARSWAVQQHRAGLKTYTLDPTAPQVPTNAGSNGGDGANGTTGSEMGALTEDGYTTSDGTKGGDGGPGGGGAGGLQVAAPTGVCSDDTISKPGCGPGGGAGGCGALAGLAGTGGGASVGASLFDSDGLVFDAVELYGGTGGNGGMGSFGTLPTLGGAPGSTVTGSGVGGQGGRGGLAGWSGGGGGGPSLGLAHVGGAPSLVNGASAKAGKGGIGAPPLQTSIVGQIQSLPGAPDGKTADVFPWTR